MKSSNKSLQLQFVQNVIIGVFVIDGHAKFCLHFALGDVEHVCIEELSYEPK